MRRQVDDDARGVPEGPGGLEPGPELEGEVALGERFAALLECEVAAARLIVAFSGGVDSTALLAGLAAARAAATHAPRLAALHVHHGLHAEADAWAEHCAAVCARLGVVLATERVAVASGGGGLEQRARSARYRAFRAHLQPGDLLLTGHHRDDQVETILLRLLRGTGPSGLAGIPPRRRLGRGEVARPLLDVSRRTLAEWIRARELPWIDDPSNAATRHDRNYLRQEVLPRIEQRWPAYRRTVARAGQLCGEADAHQMRTAETDLAHIQQADGGLVLRELCALPDARQRQVLRHWLAGLGLVRPGKRMLAELLRQCSGPADAQLRCALGEHELRRYRGVLYALAGAVPHAPDRVLCWKGAQTLDVGTGRLHARQTHGAGLAAARAAAPWCIAFRRGGERVQPAGREGRTTLKKAFQEYAVPPWKRARIPLIFVADRLAAVGDLWVEAAFAAGPEEPSWCLTFESADAHSLAPPAGPRR